MRADAEIGRGLARSHRQPFPAARPADAVRWAGGLALLLVAFYVVLYPLRGFRIAVGADTPVYVFWARRTGELGFRSPLAGSRPGTVGLIAALAGITRTRVGVIVAAIGPVFAAAIALGAGALTDVCLGRDRVRFTLVTVFTGTFLSLLVPGYLSTLAFAAMFLGGVTILAMALGPDRPSSWGQMVAAAMLLGSAGLAHPALLALAAGILGGGILLLAAPVLKARLGGGALLRSGAATVVMATAIGGLITVEGLRYVGPAARAAVETSRDSMLRTVGLSSLSRDSYIRVLHHFFPSYRAALVLVIALTALIGWNRKRTAPEHGDGRTGRPFTDRDRLFWGVMAAWFLVTLGGIASLYLGISAPGQRLAALCLAAPVLGGVGLVRVRGRLGPSRRLRWRVLLAVASLALVGVAWLFWWAQQPLSSSTATQFRAAGAALAAEPVGTPLILVSDDRTAKPGYGPLRFLNYLRDATPTDRIQDVQLFVGTPAGLLAGRPSVDGIPEHDRMAREFWNGVVPLLHRKPTPLAVVIQRADPEAYASVFHLPEVMRNPSMYSLAPGVMTVPHLDGTALTRFATVRARAFPPDSGVARFQPWHPVWVAPVLLLLLGIAGWPWARLALPRTDPALLFSLAPAFGMATLTVAAMAVDGGGLRMNRTGGVVAMGVALAGGTIALLVRRRANGPLIRRRANGLPDSAPGHSGG